MPQEIRSKAEDPVHHPPLLARLFAPAGPAMPTRLAAAGTGVTSVPGRYCVTHILEGPEAVVLVDVGSASDLPGLTAMVERLGKSVALVVPTHLHFDHAMGIDTAAEAFSAPIGLGSVAHEHVVAGQRLRWPSPLRMARYFAEGWLWQGLPLFAKDDLRKLGLVGFPWSRNAFASVLGPVLRAGGPVPGLRGWVVIDTPGHADDAICLYHRESGFLVSGDTVRNFQGGEWNPIVTDPAAYLTSIERLKGLPVQAIFFGHGPVLFGENLWSRIRPLPPQEGARED